RPEASDEEITEAAKAAGAHEFISKLPNGYETLLGERGVKLSGGQKQRISLARMFLKNPKVVLLDEATAALDNITEKEITESLKRFLQGRTVITVAHRIQSIQHYDKIVFLQDGKVAESGSYQELVRKEGWFSRMLGEDGRIKERSI
ncbi:MAG TPA: ATP-binding cassette domain-containing protein, partial [Paenibacillus sp.]|nr:ATP-binding cassette domain-containing protein [Paenibacillus sp.]